MENTMINGAEPHARSNDVVKVAYNDWVELLNHAGAADMLKDPYNVWLEAFHVATLFERHGIMHALQTKLQLITPEEHDGAATLTVEAVKQIQMRMLRQVMDLIASKGLSRA
jgi:hypothetical protein